MTEETEPPSRPGSVDRLGGVEVVLAVIALVALADVALTGAFLTWRYHPSVPGVPDYALREAARWSRVLARRHQLGLVLALPTVAAWAVVSMLHGRGPGLAPVRRWVVRSAALVAVTAALVTSFAWQLVKWDQVALRAVTVGENLRGLWFAGFDDGVRFVLVGGVEVAPSTFALWVVVHLLAPLVAVAGVVAATIAGRRASPLPTVDPLPHNAA